jgi:hypothetical protein
MINPGNSDGAVYSYKQKKDTCMQKDFPPIVQIPKVCEVELKGNETLLKVIHHKMEKIIKYYFLGTALETWSYFRCYLRIERDVFVFEWHLLREKLSKPNLQSRNCCCWLWKLQ